MSDLIYTDAKLGVGTSSPNEKLTVEGVASLKETTAPSASSGYGKLYVKSSDSKLYFLDDSGVEYDLTATIAVNFEVQRALESAYLQYNSSNSIDVVFPYVFSDASAWSTISGKSTATTGKTNGDVYWLGVYFDGSKSYTPSSGPIASDISIAWSSANNSEPTRPNNGIKIATYIRGVGDAGGDCDITSFVNHNKKSFYKTYVQISGSTTTTQVNTSIADAVPPTGRSAFMTHRATASGQQIGIGFHEPSGVEVAYEYLDLPLFRTIIQVPLFASQTIRNAVNGGTCTDHDFRVFGFGE